MSGTIATRPGSALTQLAGLQPRCDCACHEPWPPPAARWIVKPINPCDCHTLMLLCNDCLQRIVNLGSRPGTWRCLRGHLLGVGTAVEVYTWTAL